MITNERKYGSLGMVLLLCLYGNILWSQHISEFNALPAGVQNTDLWLPATHSFQYLIETGDNLTEGGSLPDNCDFAGYVPVANSSKMGYLSVNSESAPGGVTILDIELNESLGKWVVQRSEAVSFDFGLPFGGTVANCSGTVTPWKTIISCEEYTTKDVKKKYSFLPDSSLKVDGKSDGYDGYGWAIEIDPVSKKVIDQDGGRNGSDKLWAMGNFKHENAVVHNNKRTVYQGADDTSGEGYLFKFVADAEENLSSGDLYVYKGSKQGSGSWLQLENNSPMEQSTTLAQCLALEATSFGGIEDVEISPIDGMVYFAVKREDLGGGNKKGVVFRFKDRAPLDGTGVENFEIYAGGDAVYNGEVWGNGTDNLVFDDMGNLWVAQDESGSNQRNYIWVIDKDHRTNNPKVRIFAQVPLGSEPTGLTFSPDNKYVFMSIQHPDENNNTSSQPDAFGEPRKFDKDVVLVIGRKENFNQDLTADKDIVISQYYHNEVFDSKWLEIKNISGKVIEKGKYFLSKYDDVQATAPLDYEPIPEMAIDEVLLFKNSGALKPDENNLGTATQIETSVCELSGNEFVVISSTLGPIAYKNRRDKLGDSSLQNWGFNTSMIRGGDAEGPNKDFDIRTWLVLDSLQEVDVAPKNSNMALGTQARGATIWKNNDWDNLKPDRSRNVEIRSPYLLNEDILAYNLWIHAALHFSSESTNSVVVYNDLTITDEGSFSLADKASLMMYKEEAKITGQITKQEHSTKRNFDYDMTYWSSPVADAAIDQVFAGVNPNRIFYYDASKAGAADPMEYWTVPLNTDSMIPALGYAAEGLEGSTEIHEISFTGKPNNGLIRYDLKGVFSDANPDNDYNLIGNPYPSAIDIDLFFDANANAIDQAVYLWTHASPISDTSGDFVSTDYAVYNKTGSVGVNGSDPPTYNIGSGQGFFVRALKSEQIEFNNTMRLTGYNDQFYKKNNEKEEKDRLWLHLSTNQGGFSQLLIGFLEGVSDGMDQGFDALKLEGGNPIGFYSVLENKKLMIQGLAPFSTDKIVHLGFDTKVAPRQLTIAVDRAEGVFKDSDIYLLDRELNILHDLKKTDYQFEQLHTGVFKERFDLQFVNTALDVDDVQLEDGFTVINAESEIQIKAPKMVSKVKLYDLMGRLLMEHQPNSKNFKIQTGSVKPGTILIVEVTLEPGVTSNKKVLAY